MHFWLVKQCMILVLLLPNSVLSVIYFVYSQFQAQKKDGGLGGLMANIKFSHFIMKKIVNCSGTLCNEKLQHLSFFVFLLKFSFSFFLEEPMS